MGEFWPVENSDTEKHPGTFEENLLVDVFLHDVCLKKWITLDIISIFFIHSHHSEYKQIDRLITSSSSSRFSKACWHGRTIVFFVIDRMSFTLSFVLLLGCFKLFDD